MLSQRNVPGGKLLGVFIVVQRFLSVLNICTVGIHSAINLTIKSDTIYYHLADDVQLVCEHNIIFRTVFPYFIPTPHGTWKSAN